MVDKISWFHGYNEADVSVNGNLFAIVHFKTNNIEFLEPVKIEYLNQLTEHYNEAKEISERV